MTMRRYERGYSFGGFQATSPDRPLPGTALDNELENVEASLNETISGLNDIRRADGALRNGIVTRDALSADLSTGVNPATLWQTGLQYNAQDTVSYVTGFYRCTIGHISSLDFAVDLAAGRWEKYAEVGGLATAAELARDEAVAAAASANASALTAVAQASTATTAATTATTALDTFDDRYLGEKTSLPTLDNDGNPIVSGALVSLTGQTPAGLNGMYVRRDGAWVKAVDPANTTFTTYRYVATAGQTTFSGVDAGGRTLSYSPGSVIVSQNGVTLSANTYTATSGTAVVLSTPAGLNDVVQIAAFGSFALPDFWSKVESDLRYARAFNVSAYGCFAEGDPRFVSHAANGAGFIAACNAANAAGGKVFMDGTLFRLPSVTIPARTRIEGIAPEVTIIRTAPGVSGQFLSCAYQATGSNLDVTEHTFANLSIEGSGTDGADTDLLVFPDSTYNPLDPTTYGYSATLLNVFVRGATRYGIYVGSNRNNVRAYNTTVRFCRTNLYLKGCLDTRFTLCNIGASSEHNIIADGAQYVHFSNSDVYGGGLTVGGTQAFDNFVATGGASQITLQQCSMDRADRYAFTFIADGTGDDNYWSLIDCVFTEGPAVLAGNSAYVFVSGVSHGSIVNPRFAIRGGGPPVPAVFIRFAGSGELPVGLFGASWNTANPPFTTLTNDFTKIRVAGTPLGGLLAGASNVALAVGATTTTTFTATETSSVVAQRIANTSPIVVLHETDAAANNGKWRVVAQGQELLIQVLNDAEDTASNALRIRRSGTTPVLGAPNLPTSAAGLATGDFWVDTGAARVIKSAP